MIEHLKKMKVVLDKFRKPIMVFMDLFLINAALFLAFMIRFNWQLSSLVASGYISLILWATVFRLVLFWFFGLYEWSFRYASIHEAITILKAVTVSTLLLIVIAFFQHYTAGIGRSVLLIDYLICLFFISVFRFSPRLIVNLKQNHYLNPKRVLIVGAGSAGEMIARELLNRPNRTYQPIGFIDDNPIKKDARIHGIKVLGNRKKITEIIEKYRVEEVIIAIPSAKGEVIRDIISHCEKAGTKFKILPGLHQILTGEVDIKQIRDVKPEDLLGRETVQINDIEVKSLLQDKIVLVTGAGGSIGSELCRQIVKFNPQQLILYEYNENDVYFLELELKSKYPYLRFKTIIGDIKDIGLLKYVFSKYRPQVVFHSAAHKHVPLMEKNPPAAVKNNIIGTRNFIYASEHYGVERFVLISTDKAVNSTSVMGTSKRIAEMLIQAKAKKSKTKFMAVRFGNVIGSSGSVVPLFKKQIEEGGPVTVTHPEIKRYFMSVKEATQLVLQAGALGKGGEIFVLDMGEQIKIADLAKSLITLSGFEIDRDISIKFIGLRPGEKLYEETLLNIERDKATKYDKIYITQPNDFDPAKLRRDIKELEALANIMAGDKIIRKMKEMVPSYCSNGQNLKD